MAFTLAAFEADTTLTPVGVIGPYESISTGTRITVLGPYEVRSNITLRVTKLASFVVGDDGPSSVEITPDGGLIVDGTAPRSFVLNGVPTDDPTTYVITVSGGIVVGGDSTDAVADVLYFAFVGTGSARVGGSASVAFDSIEFAAGGGVITGGAATVSEVLAPNKLTVSLPAMTVTSAMYNVSANMSVSLPAVQASSTGVVSKLADLSVTLPIVNADLVIEQAAIEASIPAIRADAAGNVGVIGAIDAQLPHMTAYSSAEATLLGRMDVRLKPIRSAGTALMGVVGEIDARLPKVRSEFTGAVGVFGSMDVQLDAMVSALQGYQQISGSMEVALPLMQAYGVAEESVAFVKTLCVNTITTALSHYENFEFNSMCEFNGMYLGASSDGLFQLELGDTDAGQEIDALMSTGDLDFGNEYVKRLTDFYVGMRSDGDMTLRISTDEGDVVEYTLATYEVDTLKQRRAKTAKGARGKYWRFEVQNTDGCDFEFDSMNATTVPTARRI